MYAVCRMLTKIASIERSMCHLNMCLMLYKVSLSFKSMDVIQNLTLQNNESYCTALSTGTFCVLVFCITNFHSEFEARFGIQSPAEFKHRSSKSLRLWSFSFSLPILLNQNQIKAFLTFGDELSNTSSFPLYILESHAIIKEVILCIHALVMKQCIVSSQDDFVPDNYLIKFL